MTADAIILAILFGFVVLPISAYMIVKFGAAGYYMARRRDRERSQKNNHLT